MPKALRSMPSTVRPASVVAATMRSTISRRTATTTTRHARAGRGVDDADRLEVHDGLVHRHRDVVRRLGLDQRGERLRVLGRHQVQRADDDALVGDADAHVLGQLVLGEEVLEGLGEAGHVGDLAVAEDAGAQARGGAARDGDVAIHGHLGGGEMARVELEADHAGLGGALLEREHVS